MASAYPAYDESTDAAVHAYLVPTPAGAWHAVASNEREARRSVLMGLLQGAARVPVSLVKLIEWTAVTDRKAVRSLLFKMQRDGWLNADVNPLELPEQPLDEALPRILRDLSDQGAGLLGDDAGLCIAYSGFDRVTAEKLAAFSTAAYGLYRRYRTEVEESAGPSAFGWALLDDESDFSLTVRSLYVGDRVFSLIVGGKPRLTSEAFVRLAALLSNRCLGRC